MKDIVFLLIPGFANSKLWFEYKVENNKITKIDFLDNLKKIGEVYTITFNWFNIDYYYVSDKPNKLWDSIYKKHHPYSKDIDFKLKDLDYSVICDKLHTNLRKKYHKQKIIPIGHGYGADLAYMFSIKYAKECLFTVSLNGNPLQPEYNKEIYKRNKIKYDKLMKITDKQLDNIIADVKRKVSNNNIDLIYDIIEARSVLYKVKHFDKLILKTPYIFYALKYSDDDKWNAGKLKEKELIFKHNIKTYFIHSIISNTPPHIWHSQMISRDILDTIFDTIQVLK